MDTQIAQESRIIGQRLVAKAALAVFAALTMLGVLSTGPQTAAAITIGSDLNRAPNVTYGCGVTPGTSAFGGRTYIQNGVPTCTYLPTTASGAESPQARKPGGILTSVSVRTGPVVGPMQATIVQFTRTAQFGPQCCTYQRASQVFIPRPNTITTVPVRLPMRNDFVLRVGEIVDYLALTVLDPNVPVPMQDLGGGSLPGAFAFYPHMKPGDVRVDGAGLGGVVPLIAGNFEPTCGASSVKAASAARNVVRTAATRCLPAVAFSRNRAKVRRNRVRATLFCNAAAPCLGSTRVLTRKKRGRKLASGKVRLAAAGKKSVKLRMTKRGRSFLRRKRSRKVWLVSKLTSEGKTYTYYSRIKLYR